MSITQKEFDALKTRNTCIGLANKHLVREVALRDAMVLTRYSLTPKLDKTAALEGSTELTKMKQPMAHGWAVTNSGVVAATFTAKTDLLPLGAGKVVSWHASELTALGAYRNHLARRYAGALADLDDRIAEMASRPREPEPAAEVEQPEGDANADR